MKIKTKSCKAKGRTLQNEVVLALMQRYSISSDDIKPAVMGEFGVDIKLSSYGKHKVPFDIECKNQQNLPLWGSLAQAEFNTEQGRIPLLVFRRNRSKTYAIIEFDKLLRLI